MYLERKNRVTIKKMLQLRKASQKGVTLLGGFLFSLLIGISQSNAQSISPKSGFYETQVEASLQDVPETAMAYYTLDGSIPNTSSAAFTEPITITETTALKVAVFSSDYSDTSYIYSTYFINESTELPVLAITTDPAGFFSDTAGIYVTGTNGITGHCRSTPQNWNQDWERPVHLEFFEKDRTEGFNIDAGVKIGGGCTRIYDQKSLDIFFRSEYGESKLNYHLFEDKDITKFDRLALRSGGQDWYRAMIRNAGIQAIMRDNMDLGYQAFKPVVMFLNGEYWGIHMLREKQNEDFIESNYGYDENELDILSGHIHVKEGSADHYNAMIDFIESNDLTIEENYRWVTEQMDIDQFIDYQVAEIYVGNGDWPANNIIFWRPQTEGGKWRWLLYDADMSMGSHGNGEYDSNNLYYATSTNNDYYANPTWATLLLRKLLTNTEFKNKFIQRYNMHIFTTFEKSRMQSIMDSTAALIASEVPAHMERWEKAFRLGKNMDWEKHLEVIREFIERREYYASTHLREKFNLGTRSKMDVVIQPEDAGLVRVAGQVVGSGSGAVLFNSIPANIEAEAKPGYTFVGWSGISTSKDSKTQVTLEGENTSITAKFARNTLSPTEVVINEVNYRSSDDFDPDDWVEFYNNSDESVDISGWYFSDSDISHKFIFPSSTILEADSYLVLTKDEAAFSSLFPDVDNTIGDMDFGLSGDGELIRLYNASGEIVDSLTYNDKAPWPIEADGLGATMALANPGLDNSDGSNWAASTGHGTPGAANSDVYVGNETELDTNLPQHIKLEQNYPNPFNPTTTISYAIDKPGKVSLAIYDITGRTIETLVNERKAAGTYHATWNASKGNLSSGVYFYKLEVNGETITKKLTLIK